MPGRGFLGPVLLVSITPIALIFNIFGQAPYPRSLNISKPTSSLSIAVTPFTDESALRVKVNTNLVQIPVTVIDKTDQAVDHLGKDNFLLYENGVQQTISHFETGESPISACLVFDSSLSMADKIHKSIEAISEILDTAIGNDEYCLVRFSNLAELMVGMTDGTKRVANTLKYIHPGGFTALLDAIYLSLGEVKHGHNTRKAIVLISDGGDNRSEHTANQIKQMVREADAQVYSIGILAPDDQMFSPEEINGPALMKSISHESGGRLFRIHEISELPSAVTKINTALRHQYILGYYPKDARNDGQYRHITVKLDLPKGMPRVRAYWRTGYYSPSE